MNSKGSEATSMLKRTKIRTCSSFKSTYSVNTKSTEIT